MHIPRTCTNISVAAPQRVIHFNISFPTLPKCSHKCRAWYDTRLGGLGSRLGVANSIDLEALAHRLKNTGSDVSKAVTLNAKWLPTTTIPHEQTLAYQKQMLHIFTDSSIQQYWIETKTTALFSWTKCSLQLLYTLTQK